MTKVRHYRPHQVLPLLFTSFKAPSVSWCVIPYCNVPILPTWLIFTPEDPHLVEDPLHIFPGAHNHRGHTLRVGLIVVGNEVLPNVAAVVGTRLPVKPTSKKSLGSRIRGQDGKVRARKEGSAVSLLVTAAFFGHPQLHFVLLFSF